MAPRIIAISGRSGCGNTTVSRLLSERLGFTLINYTFRSMAKERGISFEEMLALANADNEYAFDRELDSKQVELARQADCVIGSRLAIWLLPDASLRVYLAGSLEVRAARIHSREGSSLEEKLEFTKARDEQDRRRYRQIYGLDTDDLSVADLVINSERWNPDAIVEIIAHAFEGL